MELRDENKETDHDYERVSGEQSRVDVRDETDRESADCSTHITLADETARGLASSGRCNW